MILSTDLILKGGNPYDFINHPVYMNIYGIMYNYVVIPFYKMLSGVSHERLLLLAHRAATGVFIFLSCSIVALIMLRLKIKPIFIYGAFIIQYASLIFFVTPLSKPDSLGMFLFLLCIYIPWRNDYSRNSLILSIIFGLLSFYTKIYFVLGTIMLLSYVFFYISKEKGLKWMTVFFASLLLSLFFVNRYYESYIYYTIIHHINANSYNIHSNNYHHIKYLLYQLYYFGKHSAGLIMFLLLILIYNIYKHIDYYKYIKIDYKIIKNPFFTHQISLFTYCAYISMIVLVLILGGSNGAWMIYFFQIYLPFFLISTIALTNNYNVLRHISIILLSLSVYTSYSYCLFWAVIPPMGVFSIDPSEIFMNRNVEAQWRQYNSLIQKGKNILVAAPLSISAVSRGQKVYDSGFSCYRNEVMPKNPVLKKIFSNDFDGYNELFMETIEKQILNKQFDIIILYKDHYEGGGVTNTFIRNINDIDKNYQVKFSSNFQFLHSREKYFMSVYYPRQ
ncbi:hypothetical protein [Candidatus Magnetominusculus xianensis]|nr:hypothetical protein [Candidatus Magnetominusculus xianensis]MBF0404196.1 hypothetical protein [Nitrospirota bacterium]